LTPAPARATFVLWTLTTRPGDPLSLATRQDLDPLSVAECDARIAILQAEIVRTQARRDKAVDHRATADSIFRK
jgi:uncharacterized small protein (DUF1192 family)